MTLEVSELLTKSRRSLGAARRLYADGDFDFAVSRAYYAMFYLAEALLLQRGLAFSRHGGVIAALQRQFVSGGQLAQGHHAALQRAFDNRNIADYDVDPVTQEIASGTLADAEAFLRAAEPLLA
jgi:uncharacterized protein (UPF0332 family)